MTHKNITHRIIIEESKDNSTFEKFLQSKMSLRNRLYDILNLLKYNQHIFLSGRISVVQSDVLSGIAFF